MRIVSRHVNGVLSNWILMGLRGSGRQWCGVEVVELN